MAVRLENYVHFVLTGVQNRQLASTEAASASLAEYHCALLNILSHRFLPALLHYIPQCHDDIASCAYLQATITLVSHTLLHMQLHRYPSSFERAKLLAPNHAPGNDASSVVKMAETTPLAPFVLSENDISIAIGSLSYVFTWHTFGVSIGKNLAEEEEEEKDEEAATNAPTSSNFNDLLSNLMDTMSANMNKSKLKKAKSEDEEEKEKASKPALPELELFACLHHTTNSVLQCINKWNLSGGESEENAKVANNVGKVLNRIVDWVHSNSLGEHNTQVNNVNVNDASPAADATVDIWRRGDTIGCYESLSGDIELNFQTASIYLRRNNIYAVPAHIARDPSFRLVFGNSPQHYACIDRRQNREVFAIFGMPQLLLLLSRWDLSSTTRSAFRC